MLNSDELNSKDGLKPAEDNPRKVQVAGDPYLDYIDAKKRFYRDVLRKQDQEYIRMLTKVPDDWIEYESAQSESSLHIQDETKHRLTDIKKAKSWEIKFESVYVFFILSMERQFIDCMYFRPISDDEIRDGLDSVNSILVELGGNIVNFKNLLLGLAKRSVSDLYYLMNSYYRFFKKMNFSLEEHFPDFCRDAVAIIQDSLRIRENLSKIHEVDTYIRPFFTSTTQPAGWRLDEISLRKYIEKNEKDPLLGHEQLKKTLMAANSIKMRLKKTHDFIGYYYHAKDGKEFRYDYINETFKKEYDQGKTAAPAINGFRDIYRKFGRVVQDFDRKGLEGFGPPGFSYQAVLEFIYRAGKTIEFIYLRRMMNNDLNDIRTSILRPCEQELLSIKQLKTK